MQYLKIAQLCGALAVCLFTNLNCLVAILGGDDSAAPNLLPLLMSPGSPPNDAGSGSSGPKPPDTTPPGETPPESPGGPEIDTPTLYTIRIAVTGLAGTGLVLRDQANRELAVASDGSHDFPVGRADGDAFLIEVKQRPGGPSQYCRVKSGVGQINGADALVNVQCMASLRMLGNINHKATLRVFNSEIISSNNEIFFVANDSDNEHRGKLWSLRGTEPYPIPDLYFEDTSQTELSSIHIYKERNGTIFFSARRYGWSSSIGAVSSAPDSAGNLGDAGVVDIRDSAFTGDDRLIYPQIVDSLNVEVRSYRNKSRTVLATFTSGYTPSYGTQPELRYFTSMNGVVYFRPWLFDWDSWGYRTMDLWRTDGTVGGTYRLREMHGDDYGGFAQLGNELYFIAVDGPRNSPRALWKTDGTSAGTVAIMNLPAGPGNLTASGNKLYFTTNGSTGATKKIWVSDGTATGTREVTEMELSEDPPFHAYNGSIYFLRETGGVNGLQLLRCDEHGISVVRNDLIGDQTTGHDLKDIKVANGLLFFMFKKYYSTDNEIWRTDGTPAGTFRVAANVRHMGNRMVPYQSGVAFPGSDSTTFSIFHNDGTQDGTTRLYSNYIGANSHPTTAAGFGDLTFFTANDGAAGREPWITDGTSEGTVILRDIIPGYDSDPLLPTTAGSRLFFFAERPYNRRKQLWITDGSPAGTRHVQTFNLWDSPYAGVTFAIAQGNNLIFALDHETFGNELWLSDGTAAGTRLVGDLEPGTNSSSPVPLGFLNSRLIFSAQAPGPGRELWIMDSSASGVTLLKDIDPGGWSSPVLTAAAADTIYFTARAPGSGKELWKTDGTAAGTVLVKDISPGNASTEISGAIILDSKLYFVAETAGNGKELWVSDGTSAGTRLLKDIASGADDSDPDHLTIFKGMLYFIATSPDHGRELWRTDGTESGTVLVKDIRPGIHGSQPTQLTVAGNHLYFSASPGSIGTELWITDGSEPGTMLLRDIYPGFYSSNPSLLTAVGDKLLFTAYAGTGDGVELWQSDGTPGGTFRVSDIWPGPTDSKPQFLSTTRDGILFSAEDGVHGRELWMYNP